MSHLRHPPPPPAAARPVARRRPRALGRRALEVLRARGEQARGVDRRQGDDTPAALEHVRAVVKSPGVPAQAPVIAAARERGLPVLGEVELAWRLIPNEFIAVTGTNGKTTTTELIGHIHREAGRPVAVAGNVGTALSSLVGHLAPDATVVCEVSSFQLEDAVEFAPEGAVLLNLAPDHLDRHGTFEAYTRPSCASSPTRATTTSRSPRSGSGSRTSAAARGACASATARRPSSPTAPGSCGGTTSRCSASRRSACAGCTTAATRWRRRRSAWRAASSPTPCARPCAASPASSTASRRSRASTACSSSTTPRRPTSPRRWWRSRASTRRSA